MLHYNKATLAQQPNTADILAMDKDDLHYDDPLKWLRAYRQARALNLTAETQERLKEAILTSLGRKPEREALAPEKALLPQSEPPELETELRQLIENKASWQTLAPVALQLYQTDPSANSAAQLCEMAFLYGGVAEAAHILEFLQKTGQHQHYRFIHPAIRVPILSFLWGSHSQSHPFCTLLLQQNAEATTLEPAELLFRFMLLAQTQDYALGFLYFQHHRQHLLEAASAQETSLGLSPARVYLVAATLASHLGRHEELREALSHIPTSSPEFLPAQQLLHSLSHAKPQATQAVCRYHQDLQKAPNAEQKLALLQSFLEELASTKAASSPNHVALNAILADLLGFFPPQANVWERLSSLLLAYEALAVHLPQQWSLFLTQITTLHGFELETSLWRPLANHEVSAHTRPHPLAYLSGVAHLHLFLALADPANDEQLFMARALILQHFHAGSSSSKGLLSWQELWDWARESLEQKPSLLPTQKQRLLLLLKAAADPATLHSSDLQTYVAAAHSQPPASALEEFRQIARQQGAPDLEISLILKANKQASHLINADLGRLWTLAASLQNHDFAWRVLTVFANRKPLPPGLAQAWQVSGEHKTLYPIQSPKASALDCCLQGFTAEEARLAWACLKVGGALPALLSHCADAPVTYRLHNIAGKNAWELKIDELLRGIKWLEAPKKNYAAGTPANEGNFCIPAFAEKLPQNLWSTLVAIIGHRMGLPVWKWRVSVLQKQLSKMQGQKSARWHLMAKEVDELSKWKRGLSAEQRSAWYDLKQLSSSLDDTRGFCVLASFVCRLAALIYPAHHQVLSSLVEMRAPVFLKWDLENWILSPSYSQLRKDLNLEHRVPIPASLQSVSLS